MDLDVITALIEAFEASDLTELEYSGDGGTLRLVRRSASPDATRPAATRPATNRSATTRSAAAPAPARALPMTEAVADAIVAPLFGVVHLQQAPDAPPLVSVGQSVSAGQVLCVIEAMKVFNQIRAERDCVIASVLVRSGPEVEAGEPLFGLG
jgi:acetyl-CoA carboxylase biotin carboxyl carrier protein